MEIEFDGDRRADYGNAGAKLKDTDFTSRKEPDPKSQRATSNSRSFLSSGSSRTMRFTMNLGGSIFQRVS